MTNSVDTPQADVSPSLWQHKPWWCQPWSIVLTGVAAPSLTWGITHRGWLTIPIGLGVLAWWFLFLYLVPKQYATWARSQPDAHPTDGLMDKAK